MYKIQKHQCTRCLHELLPQISKCYKTRQSSILLFRFKHNFFKNTFFPSSVLEWSNLDSSISNFGILAIFKKHIIQFIRPSANSTYNFISNFITRMRFGLNDLHEHKFKRRFLDSHPTSNCRFDTESTCYYLLHCPKFLNKRTIMNISFNIDADILSYNDTNIVRYLFYGY